MSDAPIHDAINEHVQRATGGPGLVTGYIVYAEYVDSDGDRSWLLSHHEDQSLTTSIGMVEILRSYLRRDVKATLDAIEEDD